MSTVSGKHSRLHFKNRKIYFNKDKSNVLSHGMYHVPRVVCLAQFLKNYVVPHAAHGKFVIFVTFFLGVLEFNKIIFSLISKREFNKSIE